MIHAILINLKVQFPNCKLIEKIPFDCKYKIDWMELSGWELEKDWRVVMHERDSPEAYFALLEIKTTLEEFSFSLRTVLPDLFAIHAKKGDLLLGMKNQEGPTLGLHQGEYCLAAAKADDYRLTVKEGVTIIPIYVLKKKWLLKYKKEELFRCTELIEALESKNTPCVLSKKMPIHDLITTEFLILVSQPKVFCICQDTELYGPLGRLFAMSHEDLAEEITSEDLAEMADIQDEKDLIKINAARAAIKRVYENEGAPVMADIAAEFNISQQDLCDLNKKNYDGQTLERYAKIQRFDKCYRLLEVGLSPTEVADRMKFTLLSNFSRLFKAHHGISPSEVKVKKK